MTTRMLKLSFLLSGWIILSILSVKPFYAQGVSLSIYPPVIEIQATAPSSPTSPIVIQNNKEEDVELTINLIPIKSNNKSGEVVLDPSLFNMGFYSYYKERIQFLVGDKKTDTIQLKALESKEVVVNVNLQKGDPPGDYYYAVVFLAQGNSLNQTTASQIPVGIATNLLISIAPKGTTSGGISEFKTDFFKTKGPVDFTLKIHNASKHLIQPSGEIEITNLFGQNVGKVTILPQYILAGSDRYLIDDKQASSQAEFTASFEEPKVIWDERFLLGLYRATAILGLDDTGKTIQSKILFIAFPLYLFFPLIIIIFVTLSIILKVKRKI